MTQNRINNKDVDQAASTCRLVCEVLRMQRNRFTRDLAQTAFDEYVYKYRFMNAHNFSSYYY